MTQVNSYNKIDFETAIKNVGLLADNAWATNNSEKEYKQRNQDLWVRYNEAEELSKNNIYENKNNLNNVETVKDRIPHSRLATYGNFTYDISEELFYNTCNDNSDVCYSDNYNDESEFWFCPEVEKEFKKLTSPIPTRSNQQHSCKMFKPLRTDGTLVPLQTSMNEPPSQWLQSYPWPIYLLYFHPNLKDSLSTPNKSLFNEDLEEQKRIADSIKHPPLRYSLNAPGEYELHMKLNAATVKEQWDLFCPYLGTSIMNLLVTDLNDQQVSLPMIAFNCDVPEFYPKSIRRNWHMFPSASDPNYQVDLFPYQAPHTTQISTSLPSPPSPPQMPQSQTHNSSSSTPSSTSLSVATITTTAAATTTTTTTITISTTTTSTTNITTAAAATTTTSNSVHPWNKSTTLVSPQPIPVFQRPPEFYAQSDNGKNHRKRGGVEFSNLILLARNSENENQSNTNNTEIQEVNQSTETTSNGHKQHTISTTYSEIISPLNTQQIHYTNRLQGNMDIEKITLDQINVWLNKVYPQRSEHFSEMMNTVDAMYNMALEVDKLDNVNTEQPADANDNAETNDPNQTSAISVKRANSPNSSNSISPQRRRLYRDVLSGDAENRFAQLEQEALEQYQSSDHNIAKTSSDETLAQRYQDLEREALEQYRGDKEDWFTVPVTGEDKGGAGHIEGDPDPPITITPLVSKNTLQLQGIMEDNQVGKKEEEQQQQQQEEVVVVVVEEDQELEGEEEGEDQELEEESEEAIEEESRKKEGTKDNSTDVVTEETVQENHSNKQPINTSKVMNKKPPVWMKRKKKKPDKKKKSTKSKKESNHTKDSNKNTKHKKEKTHTKDINIVNGIDTTIQHCLSVQSDENCTISDQTKQLRQLIYHLNKVNNLISSAETLYDFKLRMNATNVVTFAFIAPCLQICLEAEEQDAFTLRDLVKRTIVLKTFSMLFMTFCQKNYENTVFAYDDYKSKYMEISNNNDIDTQYQRNKIFNIFENKLYYESEYNFKLCRICFLNQILSKMAWSCFQTFHPFSVNIIRKKIRHKLLLKNTSFYQMKLNNYFECTINAYYEKYCKDVMKYNEWKSVGYLIDENSGKYFINKNLYGLIKDWSWIYYYKLNTIKNTLLIDTVIDEVALIYFNSLISETLDCTSSLIFQIDWLDNYPCYYCNDITVMKCFNSSNFVCILSNTRRKTNYINEKLPNKQSHKSRHSRKSKYNNSLNKTNNIAQAVKSNEHKKIKISIKRRIQSDSTLYRKSHSLEYKILTNTTLRRNISMPINNSRRYLPLIYHNEDEITHYINNYKKQNKTACKKWATEKLIYAGYEQMTQSGDETIKDVNFKHLNTTNILKKLKNQNKTSIQLTQKDNLGKEPSKHSCILQ